MRVRFEEDMETKLPICTVGYLVRGMPGQEEILLGEKAATPKAVRRKIAGKLIGYGGDFEPSQDTSIRASFKRELAEESDIVVEISNLEVLAEILIKDETGDRLMLYYLFVREWQGEAQDKREITKPRWYPTRPLPNNILGADKLILPRLIHGQKLSGWVRYDKDMNVVDHDLKTVDSFDKAL
jgi:hypothetical protein